MSTPTTRSGRSSTRERLPNLNFAEIQTECGPEVIEDSEYAPAFGTQPVECYFRDVQKRLIERIADYPVAVGCVAWLSDRGILDALAKKRSAIVIQKEDFLRPDSGRFHRVDLRAMYAKVGGLDVGDLPHPLPDMSVCSNTSYKNFGVRCVGYAKRGSDIAVPRMHHKFLVFGRQPSGHHTSDADDAPWVRGDIEPQAVWTGSFNFTHNGGESLENAVFIRSPKIAGCYLREFAQVAALSEPLDWTSEYVEPEWRIGT